jgi:CubicO group peptidase (beta-lactamase class C family)
LDDGFHRKEAFALSFDPQILGSAMKSFRDRRLAFPLGMLFGLALSESALASDRVQSWPTASWPVSTPAEQGMDASALTKLVEYGASHEFESLLVIRHGAIVTEAYYAPFRAGVRHRIYSVTKSIIGTLIAIALKEGDLDSVTHPVMDFFADRTVVNLDENKKAITIENLLDMTSGLSWADYDDFRKMRRSADWQQYVLDQPMVHAPGTTYNYNSGNAQLLSAILTKITGRSALDYARDRLFSPLGISDVQWSSDPQGISNGGNGLSMLPRDMAKLGYLYLQNGLWDGREIISPSWIEKIRHASVVMDVPDLLYGNLFWIAPKRDAYLAEGHNGQRIFVMPGSDMIVVTTGTGEPTPIDDPVAPEMDMIAATVKSDAPLPADVAAQTLLSNKIAEVATEKPSPVREAPDIAKAISGKIYRFSKNPLHLSSFTLNLTSSDGSYEYETATGISDGPVKRHEGPIGLDGVYRTGVPTSQGTTAAKGAWSYDGTFVAQFQELGADNLRRAIFSFKDNRVHLTFAPNMGPGVELDGEANN